MTNMVVVHNLLLIFFLESCSALYHSVNIFYLSVKNVVKTRMKDFVKVVTHMVVSIFISFLDFTVLNEKKYFLFLADSVEVVTNMVVIHNLLFISFLESLAPHLFVILTLFVKFTWSKTTSILTKRHKDKKKKKRRRKNFCHIDMKQNHLAFGFTENRSVADMIKTKMKYSGQIQEVESSDCYR